MTLGRLTAALRARGHAVSIVRPHLRASFWLEVVGELDTTWVPGAPMPGYRDVRLGWPATRRLGRAWTAHRPEAVYVATPGPLGWAAVRTARCLGIRVFSGYHTNFADYACHYGARWLARAIGAGLRAFHNRTLGTLVPSVDLMRRLRAAGFENLTLLGRGVDCRLFSPTRRDAALRAQWGARGDELIALYVGRIAAEKNVALAIEAYRAMKRAGLARQLVVVGDGPLRETLQRAHPDVLFCGAQTGLALAAHYASADVFLFPSETETFGNVVLEAMASRTRGRRLRLRGGRRAPPGGRFGRAGPARREWRVRLRSGGGGAGAGDRGADARAGTRGGPRARLGRGGGRVREIPVGWRGRGRAGAPPRRRRSLDATAAEA